MNTVQGVVLSLLISLSGWLHDGLTAFKEKKYDNAVTILTKIIETEKAPAFYTENALFYRAKAYYELKNKKKALADLLKLMRNHSKSIFSSEARKLYKNWGGNMTKLLPADSPKAVWKKLLAALKKQDSKTAMALTSGVFREMLVKEIRGNQEKMLEGYNILSKAEIGEEKIGKGDESGTASLVLSMDGTTMKYIFKLDKKNNKWLMDAFDETSFRGHGPSSSISNVNNLKQIGLALRMYSNVYDERFPANLNALKTEGFLENEAIYMWTNPETGKQLPFIYAPGYNESDPVETMLAAAPKAAKGRREVLFIDGHVQTISENEFIKKARQQKWRLRGIVKKDDVPQDKRKKAIELIGKLGNDDFDVRKKAKNELIKMGDDAIPFLEENLKHSDPEVRMNVKEILDR